MALKLRLARAGSKKRPYYHIVVADVRAPRDGRFIERVGHWNPMLPKGDETPRIGLNEERIKYWMSHGAVPTDRVLRFLDEAGLSKREARNNPKKAEPGKKAQERVEEKRMKEEEAAEAAKAAEEEAKAAAEAAANAEAEAPAEEAPVEEAPAEASAEEAPAEAPAEEAPAAEEEAKSE